MAYDDVILRMGEFGRYQRRIYLLLCLPAIICAFHKMGGVFLGSKPDTRCLLPVESQSNATFILPENYVNVSYPMEETIIGVKKIKPSQCKMYDINIPPSVTTLDQYALFAANNPRNVVIPCDTFVYDKSRFTRTVVTQWNLVCDESWLVSFGDSLFMVGVMLGSIIFGYLSDKYGRRPIFFMSLVIQLVSGTVVGLAPNFITYVIFRAIIGSTTSGVFLVAYVIALEMVGPKKRLIAGVGCQLFFTFGFILTAGFAYFIRDWQMLQIALTLPNILFLAYWWFIPESARWLLTKGQTKAAKELLQKASKENGIEIMDETLEVLLHDGNEGSTPDVNEPSLIDLFRYPNLRRKSFLLFFNWFINSGAYYGLSWASSKLSDNEFVTFALSGAVEVPAYLFLIFTLNKWGRKVILCGCMIASGVFLVATPLVPAGLDWLTITFVMIAKFAITASYGAIYVFTAEQFPTVVRNVGLGASSTFARVGGIIAPFINHLDEIWFPLPNLIYGGAVLFAGLLSLLLPETLNKKLPESIQDGEQFGMKKKKQKKIKKVLDLNDISLKSEKTKENGIYEK
ncbi:organic cation transporter protein-like [Leptopilina heterotoma]|uniref:organic cation transporter protein-like n=1 Tax=Leptopilina heterotoma TaxID=63436 RepID=UPI001CAA39F6|nr:organic cation transporter protein-like [Leptopilina heterotoma]XP_043468939.1 organic cation transporter protein-like [Leptopilina heterotoma]XP_043468940.1 organic cation transporter protein-like [Leptopilina heterotoma]XP_043468942.1 organic cation transporter protein-like [Leptopilina heterotoma]XP_043468943.1 organic cation transporter protein-like [Leptopilina heterotoma]XP_043468944.1 organic cation transporter protein-like [Leptopilina heterotoma]